jgi:hypothetical protein
MAASIVRRCFLRSSSCARLSCCRRSTSANRAWRSRTASARRCFSAATARNCWIRSTLARDSRVRKWRSRADWFGILAREQELQRIRIAADELAVEKPCQLVLLRTRLVFQAPALLVEIGQFGFQSGAFGAQFMQAPIDVGNGRFGFAQLIGGIGLRFLGLCHVAAQGFDADLQVLQFFLFRIDAAANAAADESRGSRQAVKQTMHRRITPRPCTDSRPPALPPRWRPCGRGEAGQSCTGTGLDALGVAVFYNIRIWCPAPPGAFQ